MQGKLMACFLSDIFSFLLNQFQENLVSPKQSGGTLIEEKQLNIRMIYSLPTTGPSLNKIDGRVAEF